MLDLKQLASVLEGSLTRAGCRNIKDLLDEGPGNSGIGDEPEW